MDKVIEKLINIENKAQSVVQDVKRMQADLDKTVADNVGQIQQEIDERVALKKQTIADIERKAADKRIAAIQNTVAEEQRKMREKYKTNLDSWVNQIFDHVLGS